MLDFLLLIASLALLLYAANHFVAAMSAIAAALGVPPLVIGLTVVAFGTSLPELVINTLSAYQGSTALAFGNITGASVLNIGFVLGLTAIIKPMRLERSLIIREIPMMLVAISAVTFMACDQFFRAESPNRWDRNDGLVLLLFFGIFLYYSTFDALEASRGNNTAEGFLQEASAHGRQSAANGIAKQIGIAIAAMAAVSFSADWTVERAVNLARILGMPENVIGLTIISMGTTLPELATSILAARRGNADLALGNVVGSNIFNLLCIGGLVSAVRPVEIPASGGADLLLLCFLGAVILPLALFSGGRITRWEGAFLLATLLGYMAWRILSLA